MDTLLGLKTIGKSRPLSYPIFLHHKSYHIVFAAFFTSFPRSLEKYFRGVWNWVAFDFPPCTIIAIRVKMRVWGKFFFFMEFFSSPLRYSLDGCCDQISISHSNLHKCHNHLKSYSPTDYFGAGKKSHSRLLPWSAYTYASNTLKFSISKTISYQNNRKPHMNFIAALQYLSFGNKKQKIGTWV